MKIALLSDIHANLPALEACLTSIDDMKPDAIYCLGDLVGYNTWPNEVINTIRARAIPSIAGNYDQGIGMHGDDCGCVYKTDTEKRMGKISIDYTNAVVKHEERSCLATLPEHIRLTFRFGDTNLNLLLVHGSPRRVNEYLFEDRDEKSLLRMMEQADADILCFGHTHKPWHKKLSYVRDGKTFYRHAINTGSVGKPKDGNARACYVMLTIADEKQTPERIQVHASFVRVEYDVEKAANAIEQSPLPDEYADMLRKGI